MIKIAMKRLKHSVELALPTDYEHVLVCLWKLGLDRDPGKYTLKELNAVFHYDTPFEHQMIRMIESGDTLMYALRSLHEMIAPPYPIADKLLKKIAGGRYNTAEEFYADMEQMVFGPSLYQTSFYFPITGELVDKQGNVSKASEDVLLEYESMIVEAMMRTTSQALYWKTELFTDVDGAYQKLMSAMWMVESIEDMLFGEVSLIHTEPFTEDEISDIAEKIEMINSVDFAIRLKQWSVLTDNGLLFIYLCDEDGDYSLYNPADLDEDESCLCPECQERLRKQVGGTGAVLSKNELEVSEDEC